MSFITRIQSLFLRSPPVSVSRDASSPALDAFARGVPLSSRSATQITSPYTQHGVVFACVRVMCETFGQIPLKLYRGATQVRAHALLDRLHNPAPFLTASDLVHFTLLFLETQGNCVWWLDNDGDARTVPRNILVFNPRFFSPITDRATGFVVAYHLQLGGGRPPLTLSLDEVVHFRYPNPDDPFWGIGPLQVAHQSVQQDYAAGLYNTAFFDNSAEPVGLMIYKGKQQLTPAQRAMMKEGWLDDHRGVTNAFKLGVLPGEDWDYKQLGLTHRDMQFLEQRNWNLRDISRILNVPLLFLNEHEKMGLSDAGVKAQIDLFWDTNLIPKARFLTEVLNAKFISKLDPALTCLYDVEDVPARKQDFSEKLGHAERLQKLGYPLNAINDLLDLGMTDVPWGDEPLVLGSLVPISAVIEGKTLPPPPPQLTDGTAPADTAGAAPPPPDPQAGRLLLLSDDSPQVRATHQQEQRFAAFWQSYTAAAKPLESTYQARLRRLFYTLRRDTLQHLTEQHGVRSVAREYTQDVESVLFAADAARRELRVISEPLFAQAYEAGGLLLLGELGEESPFLIDSTAARTFLAHKLVRVNGILDTVREQLRASLLDGLVRSETLLALTDRVRAVMNSANSRSLTIARTEIGQAMSGGRYDAMQEQHITSHQWLSSRDTHVRDAHAPRSGVDGEVRPLGTPFSNGLRFPLDPDGEASQVVNCRCVSVPRME